VRGAWVVFRRETAAAFDAPLAYVFAAAFLLLSGGVFMNDFFLSARAEMDAYFERLPFFLTAFLPALSMRLWAEERKHNTYELLMTLPLRTWEILLGKYLSALFIFGVVMAGTLPIPAMLFALGEPDGGKILAGYVGAGFLGALVLALGLFLSGLTRDQVVAYVVTFLAAAALILCGHEAFAAVADGLRPGWALGTWLRDTLSALPRYDSFLRGVVSLRDAAYFTGFTAYFLLLNRLTLARER
jgi:ABC-2 type transport system permease protein